MPPANGLQQHWLAAQAAAWPAGIALIADSHQTTYRELNALAETGASVLANQNGIAPGTRIAVLLPNNSQYVAVIHAIARIGAVLVPLNVRLTAAEIRYQLEVTGCTALITDGDFSVIAEHSTSETVQVITPLSLFHIPPAPFPDHMLDLDTLQAIVFTSGTTGKPKGAALTFGNQFYSALSSAYRIGTLPGDRWLCPLPLYHVGGLAIVMRCCLYGTTVILQQGAQAEMLVENITKHGATLVSLVPTMLYRLLDNPNAVRALQSLRLILLGGAASTVDLIERCAALNIAVAPTYGLSEACSQVATMLPADAQSKPGSVGRPLLYNTIEIIDEAGQTATAGSAGEIVITGPTVMTGYYQNPDATARTLRDGKLHTGDIGYLDNDGDLFVLQRRADLIVSGGENIYPVEVESVLLQHRAIAGAVVVGIADAEWGQRAAAALIAKPDKTIDLADVQRFCRERLAGYKLPKMYKIVESFPQNSSGKIQRHMITALFDSPE